MQLKPLSKKAQASIVCNGWMTVWEGAIRSGKTVASLIAWLDYIDRSPERVFFMSGKTQGSLMRNCIDGDFGLLSLAAPHARLGKDYAGSAVVRIGNKTIYLFGACDDASYMRLKGLTAGGWYADEVATHPRSFIIEALARSAVSTNRRNFWTLNPTIPLHYIYTDFIDKWERENVAGYMRFHFVLDDNLAMSSDRKAELARQYSGRWYQLYILGLRVNAEGQIYSNFTNEACVFDRELVNIEDTGAQHYICCDYGSVNPCVFLDCVFLNGVAYICREYRWDSRKEMSQKTDAEYVQDMMAFIGEPETCDEIICVDPSAVSFILALKGAGYYVIAAKNDVLSGIGRIASLIGAGKLKIEKSCVGLIQEMCSYSWDENAARSGVEKPLKTNDHGPDALRYFVNTCINSFDLYGE